MCVATLRLSHQKVENHTRRKKGVIIIEVSAMVVQANREYMVSSNFFIAI
jgi:hypothetical protein